MDRAVTIERSTQLEAAAGNPHTYDAPDATRRAVCTRILPGTYARLRLVQRQARLRTLAGAWEFLMSLGLAVAERLPSRMEAPIFWVKPRGSHHAAERAQSK